MSKKRINVPSAEKPRISTQKSSSSLQSVSTPRPAETAQPKDQPASTPPGQAARESSTTATSATINGTPGIDRATVTLPADTVTAIGTAIRQLATRLEAVETSRGISPQAQNGGSKPEGWKGLVTEAIGAIREGLSKVTASSGDGELYKILAMESIEFTKLVKYGFAKQMGIPVPPQHVTVSE